MNAADNSYYIWLGVFDFDDEIFDHFWDNDEYENAGGTKPAENLKCGFCQELGLEELMEKDFWFTQSRILYSISDLTTHLLVEQRGLTDCESFEKACLKKGIQNANTVFALSVSAFPKITPDKCTSMEYIGKFEFCD